MIEVEQFIGLLVLSTIISIILVGIIIYLFIFIHTSYVYITTAITAFKQNPTSDNWSLEYAQDNHKIFNSLIWCFKNQSIIFDIYTNGRKTDLYQIYTNGMFLSGEQNEN